MTLLQDLEALDLTAIVDARVSISASLDGAAIQGLLEGGAAQTVLGDLGATIAELRASLDNPAALLEPLVDAVAALPLDLGGFDISRYLAGVREGAEILTRLLADFDGSAASLGRSLGMSLGDVLQQAGSSLGDVLHVDTGDLAQFRQLIDQVERGTPTDPSQFAALAFDILMPFPAAKSQLRALGSGVDGLLARAGAITLPSTRTVQLVIALDAVADAAIAGDVPALNTALRELDAVRASTRAAIEGDLGRAADLIDQLGIETALGAIGDVNAALTSATGGILEFMDDLRAELASLRERFQDLDINAVIAYLSGYVDKFEAALKTHIAEAVDAQVARLKDWLRDLLRHIPLRQLRAEITRFIDAAAEAIRDADLDRYAREVFQLLDDIRSKVSAVDLGDQVRGALEDVGNQIDSTLQTVTDALGSISLAVNNLADQAREVLERAVAALRGFQAVIDEIAQAVENLGIEEAAQQVIDALATLRETAEELLSDAPLPEPMRALVEQLIDTIKDVDVGAAFEPIRNAAAELSIPDEVETTIRSGLAKVRDCLQNLIPTELIASIEAEISDFLDELRNFNPAELLRGVTDFLDDAAGFVEGLDPTPHIATIRAPFLAVLDAIDAAHPARLLAPAIEAYNDLFGAVHVPEARDAARTIGQAVGSVGETAARAVVTPVQQVMSPGSVTVGGNQPGVSQETISLAGSKPGDIVRLLGYLPNKLREGLAALDASAAGAAIDELDNLLGGLATRLREAPEVLHTLDERLTGDFDALLVPLGAAQLRAQIALRGQANWASNGASASIDLDAALTAVATAGPGAMRVDLSGPMSRTRSRAQSARGKLGGDLGARLDRIARLLEGARLSNMLGNVDALLAALDPEPVAAELDALVNAVLARAPEFLNVINTEFRALINRAKRIFEELNPIAQANKFLTVLDVLREELDVFNPARLAAELAEVHAAIRAAVAACDPIHLAERIKAILDEIATELRSLDPAALLGDLSFLDDIADRIEAALPFNALAGVGDALREVGDELAAIDPGKLLEAIDNLPERVVTQLERAVEAIKQELIHLLESLDYFTASASAEVSVGVT